MSTSCIPVFRTAAALLAAVVFITPLHAQTADDGLPGYYRWYKKAGEDPRLKEESQRDLAMETGSEWAPQSVDRMAPDWSFPDAAGKLVPLRIGGEGRNTLVVTFQSWW